ncbi:ATP-dependent 6-phosphofructokinase [Candidatus Dependentiae bacterium]|nr:ATP-dependent 6-phosphofructokinase [Candidatus Dependentiae bacterium]
MAKSSVKKKINFTIKTLGKSTIKSPLKLSTKYGDRKVNYVEEDEYISYYNEYKQLKQFRNIGEAPRFEKAGPRQFLYFNPPQTKAAIVTCGGVAPGLNDVIRALVMELYWIYGVKSIIGIPYGYAGFNIKNGFEPIELTPNKVSEIHSFGGTILGTSRGKQDEKEIVDYLLQSNISILFCIGGDGTLRGASAIYKEITKRKLKISVVGIPKTIDNDIAYMDKTFGFETAFSKAAEAIKSAHSEARSAYHGIGLVKLMGRHSGYIAANAALALKEVNFVLIPEVKFDLFGSKGLFEQVKERLISRKHTVIVVAEGAGQEYLLSNNSKIEYDASGNVKLSDIGLFLKQEISKYFKEQNFEFSLKYIDPSYMIRSLPANPSDSIFCGTLAQNAVHCAMAGKTDVVVGYQQNHFVHIPIETATSFRKEIDPESELWFSVLEATGQMANMIN